MAEDLALNDDILDAVAGEMLATKQEQQQESAPVGLSAAQLRAWKRKQNILKGGDKRMDLLNGQRDSVANDAKAECEAEQTKPAEDEDTRAASSEEPEMARWEKKWQSAAEKAPTVEISFEENPAQAEDGLRRRNVGAGTEGKEKKELGVENQINPAVDALRMKLHAQRVQTLEFWARQAVIVAIALICAMYFFGIAGFYDPKGATAECRQDGAAEGCGMDSDAAFLEDEEDGVEFGEKEENVNGFEVNMNLVLNVVDAPLGGWVSIPIAIFFLRVGVHAVASMIGRTSFSLLDTVWVDPAASKSGSMISAVFSMVPVLQRISKSTSLVKDVAEDVSLFLFVLISSLAAMVHFGS